MNPLSGSQFTIANANLSGVAFTGFDSTKGYYTIAYRVWTIPRCRNRPSWLTEFEMNIANDNRNRTLRIQSYETPIGGGMVGNNAVLCDSAKYPIGLPMCRQARNGTGPLTRTI